MKNLFTQYKGLSKSAYILFFARLVTTMGSFIWPMLTLILSTKLGYTAKEIALIFLIISLVFLPATILGGKLADKFNKKNIIIIFDIITVSFFFLASTVEPGFTMLIFFTIAGLFATMEGPAHEALTIEISLPKDREKIFSLNYLGYNLGFIVGALLSGFLIANHLSLAFILDGTTTLMSTFLIFFFVFPIKQEDIKEEDKNIYEEKLHDKESSINIIRKRKPILIQLIVVMFIGFIYDQWAFLIPLHLADLFGEVNGPIYFGTIASFNGFIVIVATPILTILLNKIFELPKLIIGAFIYTISFLLLLLAPQLPLFFIFVFLFTIAEVINTIGKGPYFSRRIPESHRGRISSYQNIGYFIGSILGKFVSGFLVDEFGFRYAYAFIVGMLVIVIFLLLLNYQLDKLEFPKLYIKDNKNSN